MQELNLLYASLTIPLWYVISIASNECPVGRGSCKEAQRCEPCGPGITRNSEAMMSFLLTCATPWLSPMAGWCLMGAVPRGQEGMPAWTPLHMRDGLRVLWTAVLWTAAGPPCVAQCMANDGATRGSISPLSYPQLLATTAMTSRHTGGLLGWIHHHIGHLTSLIHGLVPGRAGLIIGDAAHDHRGRGDRHCTERGSRYRRTNDRASDSPGRIGSAGTIIPSIAVTMVIICPLLPVLLLLLPVALPVLLLLLPIALPVFSIGRLSGLATGLRFLGGGLPAGLLAGTLRLHVLGRGLAARLIARARGLAAFLRARAIGLPISTAGRAALRKAATAAATSTPTKVPATGGAAAGNPTSPPTPTTTLGFYWRNHQHTHQDQATPGCPVYPSLRSHGSHRPFSSAAPGCILCCRAKAIFVAPAGGVKTNSASGTSGARFHSLNCAQNCGRPSSRV
jgi:hypothetical protein